MRVFRGPIGAFLALLAALLLQTTLFGRVRVGGIAPDLVMVVLTLITLRLRQEPALLLAFTIGLIFDAATATAIGLRPIAYSTLVFVAYRTKDRADFSPLAVAVWVGIMSIVGVILFFTVGTLFSQIGMDGGQALRRMIVIPLLNTLVALILWPLVGRLLEPSRKGFG